MRLISCHGGVLQTRRVHNLGAGGASGNADASENQTPGPAPTDRSFVTGLAAWDALAPAGGFARGAVHELLWSSGHARPLSPALVLARAAGQSGVQSGGSTGVSDRANGAVVWCDPRGEIYPPAVANLGVPLDRLFLLRPKNEADAIWAVAECLATRGVAAVVAEIDRLSRVQARRLQLAAERGGSVGLLVRAERLANQYAAVTRWHVAPAPGEAAIQRWTLKLLHGHGGQVGQAVILEISHNPLQTARVSAAAREVERPEVVSARRVPA